MNSSQSINQNLMLNSIYMLNNIQNYKSYPVMQQQFLNLMKTGKISTIPVSNKNNFQGSGVNNPVGSNIKNTDKIEEKMGTNQTLFTVDTFGNKIE